MLHSVGEAETAAMEDEGFVDDDFIEDVAREYVGLHGTQSIAILEERAEIAEAAGDQLSAQTWRAIAEAAESIIEMQYGFGGIFRAP